MSGPQESLRAEVVAIGDELVHGFRQDSNSRWLAGQLEANGALVERFTVVGDGPEALASALTDACARADLVLVTGGLGPTRDDRTREVVAKLCGGPLWFDEGSWQRISRMLRDLGRDVPESNRLQAEFPPDAVVIENPVGTAPGFRVRLDRAQLFCMPGVPREMRSMTESAVLPYLQALPGRMPTVQHVMRVVGPGEAKLGELLAEFMVAGRHPAVGITASMGQLTIRIVARDADGLQAKAFCEATAAEIRPLLGDWLVSEDGRDLPEQVVDLLRRSGQTLALAESCTGGLASSRLVAISGASEVFRGGVVAYSLDSKKALLGVEQQLLDEHGAVSEPVAAVMARAIKERLGANLGLAVTGIAGPAGGLPGKPVGTVCFGFSGPTTERVWTAQLPALGRTFVRERSLLELWMAVLGELRG